MNDFSEVYAIYSAEFYKKFSENFGRNVENLRLSIKRCFSED